MVRGIRKVKLEQNYPAVHIWAISVLFMLSSSFLLFPLLKSETMRTDWHITFAEEGEILPTGKTVDLHFFILDENDEPLEGAKVVAIFDRVETVHHIEKSFSSLGNGLYETEIVFSVPGTWIIMMDVKKGSSVYRNQFIVEVDGPIISEEHRDPADHFNLNQRLPIDLQRRLK